MAYFDNAATTFPKPDSVYEFMSEFYKIAELMQAGVIIVWLKVQELC